MEMALTAAVGLSTAVAVGAVAYRVARPRFLVRVNCWFCGADTKVPYGNQNCWDCPQCEQYNGFTLDGDYNKPIPAQYIESLNHPITSENKSPPARSSEDLHDVLCYRCNRNQVLKMRQLADFVPENEVTFDYEVEQYRHYLERVYSLCVKCEQAVGETLHKQDSALERKIHRHLQNSVQQADVSGSESIHSSFALCRLCAPFHVRMLRLLMCLCSLVLLTATVDNLLRQSKSHGFSLWPAGGLMQNYLKLLYGRALFFVAAGILMSVMAVYCAGRESLSGADAGSCLMWVCLLMVHGHHISTVLHHSDIYMMQVILGTFNVIFALWSTFVPRFQKTPSTRIVKRRYRNGNISGVSSTSETPNHSPEPSLAGDYTQSEPAFQQTDDGCIDLDALETLSVGTAYKTGSRHIKAFGQFGDTYKFSRAPTPQLDILTALGQKKPVLNPSRLRIPSQNFFRQQSSAGSSVFRNQAQFQNERMQSTSGLSNQVRFQDQGHGVAPSWRSLGSLRGQQNASQQFNLPPYTQANYFGDDRASLFSEPRQPTVVATDSSHSSESRGRGSSNPVVHTTFQEENLPPEKTKSPHRPRKPCSQLLGSLSVALNIGMFIAFLIWLVRPYCNKESLGKLVQMCLEHVNL